MVSGAIVAALAAGDTSALGGLGEHQPSAAPEPEPITLEEPAPAPSSSDPAARSRLEERATRSGERPARDTKTLRSDTYAAPPVETETRFLTEDLNLWTGPAETTTLLMVLDVGSKVSVTGRVVDGWAEIVHNDTLRWVNADYLATEKPEPEEDTDVSDVLGGLSDEPCASGSEVEEGLVDNAIAVHRAVCAEFPEITEYYGLRPGDDGEHGTGQAIDIMISDSATGDAIAEFVQDNYSELGVSEIIWSQQIWTVERSSEGWRWMEDRGSDTANHYDHVHVTVY